MSCYPTEFYCLTGTVLAAAFIASPTLTQVPGDDAYFTAPHPYEVLGITLTSSMLNFGTAPLGVFVVFDQSGTKTTYSKSTACPLQHVTLQNSLTGPPAVPIPTNKTTPIIFSQPKEIASGAKIALFTFGDTTAGNRADIFCSLILRQKK